MTGSTSRTCELVMPRGIRPISWKATGISPDRLLARLKAAFFGRRSEHRPLPPLKNVHYVAVHMAAATHRGSLR